MAYTEKYIWHTDVILLSILSQILLQISSHSLVIDMLLNLYNVCSFLRTFMRALNAEKNRLDPLRALKDSFQDNQARSP